MVALDRIQVEGFQSIRELDLELGPLNVLIGANGSGKSNFIRVFSLLHAIVEERLQTFVAKAGGAGELLHYRRKTTKEIFVRVEFGQNGYEARLEAARDDRLFFSHEDAWFLLPEHGKPYHIDLDSAQRGHWESALLALIFNKDAYVAYHVLESIASWQIYQFHDTSDNAKIKASANLNDNRVLRPDASNLASYLYLLRERHRDHYARIVRTIRLAAPFFDDFTLRPDPLKPDTIQLEWRELGSDAYFNASALSDGTLRFVALTTLLLQPDLPATILIDEPELGLHPYAITLLASMLRSAAAQTQVIVATQSVPLVNQFTPKEIIVVDREDGQSVFKRLHEEQITDWLADYGMGDLWEKNVIGGRP